MVLVALPRSLWILPIGRKSHHIWQIKGEEGITTTYTIDIKSLISLGMLVIIQQLMMLWMLKTSEGGVEVVKIGGAVCLDQNQGVFTGMSLHLVLVLVTTKQFIDAS